MTFIFEKTHTRYALEISHDDFLAILDSESYATNNAAYKKGKMTLGQKLDKIYGVWDVEYNGHFGGFVYLILEVEYDTDDVRYEIANVIQDHINWCKTLEVVDWVKEKREKEKGPFGP